MNKWTRRAFISTGVLAGGAAIFGFAIRPGNRASKVSGMIAESGETVLNIWLKIGTDNVVTAIVPHAEMGQGIHTTLAMMLADELDADWDKVRIMEAPTEKEYASGAMFRGFIAGEKAFPGFLEDTVNGVFFTIAKLGDFELTGGSGSVRFTGRYAMRVAGAAAREMLLKAAADSWNVPIEELKAEKSMISHAKSAKSEPYASFAARAATMSMPTQPRLKEVSEFKLMGTSPKRNDIPAKVNGKATYGIDINLPNMKYATIKAAPVFGNKIKAIDESGLKKRSGVQQVINLGNAVAVVSEGYWLAKQALSELKISYESSENDNINQDEIFARYRKALDDVQDVTTDFKSGDVEQTLSNAKEGEVIEREYQLPYLAHTTMEPMNCTIWLQKDKCELWIGSQNPLGVKTAVAKEVGLNSDQVFVYNQYLGGGFGRKAETDVAEQAAKIAKEAPFPVKLIWSREEDVQQDKFREASISRFKAVLNSAGNVIAWHNRFLFKHHPAEAPLLPYAIENQDIGYKEVATHVPWGNWRSVDHSTHGFFIESFVDELATTAKQDPYLFRKALLTTNPRFLKALTIAAEKSAWDKALPMGRGRGISITESFGSIVAEVVEVTVSDQGELSIDKVYCVADAGFAMHPDGFIAQMESGIIYGLTAVLYGEITINNGAVQQSNFHDYPMLRMDKAPEIETHIINSGHFTGGAGEPSTPGIAPAVCNAIFAATGIRIRELPIRNHDLSKAKWIV